MTIVFCLKSIEHFPSFADQGGETSSRKGADVTTDTEVVVPKAPGSRGEAAPGGRNGAGHRRFLL